MSEPVSHPAGPPVIASASVAAAWQQLDPKVIWLWRAQGLIRSVIGLGPVGVGLLIGLGFAVSFRLSGALTGLLLVGSVVQALVWPSLSWRAFRYQLRADALLVSQGVLWQQTVAIPRHRIQHADLRQGPVERAWGLTTLVVYTAAGLSADGSIPGLDEDAAEQLRDVLLNTRQRSDDGV